ncbi:MAG: alpha/beta fold hydrolase [Syntrophales bacterium]|nr:alpha/beta fold hydrolase [Syntrophales bacterium]MDD4340360.1 alpha/beta fold hydrolase [Syntrophales bacterium]HOG08472.1 alpha/beta fold hydrolase [Syntrophales bacterium]HOS78005.1 alpha/beta fold hydrolase [Syntrophales bacterium]
MKKIFIALLVVLVAVVGGYYAFPEKVADYFVRYGRSQAGLVKKEILIDDHRIVYLEGGRGPAVLLLHGYSADKDHWTRFAAGLTQHYHVVIPDIPGYGESTKRMNAKYDLSSQVGRLHRFARALGLERIHIAGNSMGGLFAGAYAARYPGDLISLGLFNAAGVKSPRKSEVMIRAEQGENLLLLKDEADLPRVMGMAFVNPPPLPYPFKKRFIEKALADRRFHEKALEDFKGDLLSLEKDLPKIKAPTLILWGRNDRIIDVSSVPVFERGLARHQTVIIENCGHLPMIEKVGETSDAYLAFIGNVRR